MTEEIKPSWSPARDIAPRRLGKHRQDAAAGNHDHLLNFQSRNNIDVPAGPLGFVSDSVTRTLMYSAYIPPESWRPGHATRLTFMGSMAILNAPARTVRIEVGMLTRAAVFFPMFDYTTPALALHATASRQVYIEAIIFHLDNPDINVTRYSTTKLEIGVPSTIGVPTDALVAIYGRQDRQAITTNNQETLQMQIWATLGDATSYAEFTGLACMLENV